MSQHRSHRTTLYIAYDNTFHLPGFAISQGERHCSPALKRVCRVVSNGNVFLRWTLLLKLEVCIVIRDGRTMLTAAP